MAKYLNVYEKNKNKKKKKGEIPAGKIGTVWRFKKQEVENWVNARLSSQSQKNDETVQLKNILSVDRITFISQSSKRDALVELSEVLAKAPQIKNAQELTQEILKREELMSTAIGKGIAIPHVRLSSVTDLVMAVGICKTPINDYQTIDDEPVKLLFMIAAAYNQHSYYLKTISQFSSKFKDTALLNSIYLAKTEQEVFDLLAESF